MNIFVILIVFGLAAAAPKPGTKLNFRNLYVEPSKKITPRIIGGQEVTPNSVPYQVFIEAQNTSSSKPKAWFCSGTLISRTFVLTSAHCAQGITEAQLIFGAHNVSNSSAEDGQVKLVSKKVIIHETYSASELSNDIAVFKLDGDGVTLVPGQIALVQLPSRADASNSYEGEAATVSGWGITEKTLVNTSAVLMSLDTEIIPNDECHNYFYVINDNHICTSGTSGGICEGDAGGPLTISGDKQVGIASFMVVYCVPGYPSAYTRITKYLDWIEANTDVIIS